MAITAQMVVDRVRAQLIDPDGTRWSDAELLRWIGDALDTILTAKANAFATSGTVLLKVGTRQSLPADGHMLLTVVRNMGADGKTPGRAVRIVTREALDSFNPNWHAARKQNIVQNYVFDADAFDTFYVYPPNDGIGSVEIIYAAKPVDVSSAATVLNITDNYLPAIADYVLFRAYQKDGDWSNGQSVAATYFNSFTQYIGAAGVSEARDDANTKLMGTVPGSNGAGATTS